MTETDAKTKMCPIIGIHVAIAASAIMQVAVTMKDPEGLHDLFESKDKNCIASKCMMWDRKRSDCGLKAR